MDTNGNGEQPAIWLRPGPAPTEYLNEKHVDKKGQCRLDPKRVPVIKQMYERVAHEQWSGLFCLDTGLTGYAIFGIVHGYRDLISEEFEPMTGLGCYPRN